MKLIQGLGTPESSWQAWAGLAALDTFDLHPFPASAVGLAPHPAHEVPAVGGPRACRPTPGERARAAAGRTGG